jgi:ABC-type Fe3+-citrate transport system substrate-binding protein
MDSNGMFEKLWQFSALIVSKGCKILEVGTDETFIDLNLEKLTKQEPDKIILRAYTKGEPTYITKVIDGVEHKVINIEGKQYIPE